MDMYEIVKNIKGGSFGQVKYFLIIIKQIRSTLQDINKKIRNMQLKKLT